MGIKVELDCSVYTQDSVKETVYRFSDKFSTIIRKQDDSLILDITFNSPEIEWEDIKQEFEKELLTNRYVNGFVKKQQTLSV